MILVWSERACASNPLLAQLLMETNTAGTNHAIPEMPDAYLLYLMHMHGKRIKGGGGFSSAALTYTSLSVCGVE